MRNVKKTNSILLCFMFFVSAIAQPSKIGQKNNDGANEKELLQEAKKAEGRYDFKKAISIYKMPTIAANAEAQYRLGTIYLQGAGVKADTLKAKQLFVSAANAGFAGAQHALGFACYFGKNGFEKDLEKGVEWYNKAKESYLKQAESGDENAQIGLGDIYHQGYAVDKDEKIANMWYAKAIATLEEKTKTGDTWAMYTLGMGYMFRQYGLPDDKAKGAQYIQKSSDMGYMPSTFLLALAYEYGIGVDKDLEMAIKLYKLCVIIKEAQDALKRLGVE